jgi:hypothetical protein
MIFTFARKRLSAVGQFKQIADTLKNGAAILV